MRLTCSGAIMLAAASLANAQTFSLLPIPIPHDSPADVKAVNADGSVAVGASLRGSMDPIIHNLRWRVGIGTDRPAPELGPRSDTVEDVSADGSVLLGVRNRTGFDDSDIWLSVSGNASFIPLPDGFTRGHAPCLSSDGRFAAFSVFAIGVPFATVRYEIATGEYVVIGSLPGATGGGPSAISADGSVIVGNFFINNRARAYRWTAETGVIDMGVLHKGAVTQALVMTADGGTVYGFAQDEDDVFHAVRWTEKTGFVPLAGSFQQIYGVSPDGRVLVGQFGANQVWDDVHGYRTMDSILRDAGFGDALQDWLLDVRAVSQGPEGYAFAGLAVRIAGPRTWWVATIPIPPACRADITDDGVLNSQDFFAFLQAFFAQDPLADFNDDGGVNTQDLFDYITAFFAGC